MTPWVNRLLLYSALALLIGRGWEHLFWEPPYRSFLWSERFFQPIIEGILGLSWDAYVKSARVYYITQSLIRIIGIIILMGAATLIFHKRIWTHRLKFLIPLSTFFLFLLTLCFWKTQFFRMGQLVEYGLQLWTPLLAYFVFFRKDTIESWATFTKIMIALTFVGHGLYAVGYYPVPGNFIDMLILGIGISEENARTFLFIAGVMDFLISGLIFYPRYARQALLYAAVWGGLTALARVWAYFDPNLFWASLHQWTFETLHRLPHCLTPLVLYLSMRKDVKHSGKA